MFPLTEILLVAHLGLGPDGAFMDMYVYFPYFYVFHVIYSISRIFRISRKSDIPTRMNSLL